MSPTGKTHVREVAPSRGRFVNSGIGPTPHLRYVSEDIACIGHRMFDGSSRLLLRQRRDGSALPVVEARVDESRSIC